MAPPKAKSSRQLRSLSSTLERLKTPPLDLTRFKSKSLSPSFIKRIEVDSVTVRRSPRLAERFKSPPPPAEKGSAKRKILQDAEMNTKRRKTSVEEKVGISGTEDIDVEKNLDHETKETQVSNGEFVKVDDEKLIKGDKRPVLLTFNTWEAAKAIEFLEEQVKLAVDKYDSGSDSTMESGLNSVSYPSFASSIDMSSFYHRMNNVGSSRDDITEEIKIEPETGALELDRSAIDLVRAPSFLYSSGDDENSYPRSRCPSLDEVTEATTVQEITDSPPETSDGDDDETLSGDSLAPDADVAGSPSIVIEVEEALTVEEATDKADEVSPDDREVSEDFNEIEDYESTPMSTENQNSGDDITMVDNDETVAATIGAIVVQDTETSEPQKVIEDIVITISELSDVEVASAMDEDIVEPPKAGEQIIDEKDYGSQSERGEAAGFKRKYFMDETCFAPAPRRSLLELHDLSHADDFPGGGALATASHDNQNMEVADVATMNDSGLDTTVQGVSADGNSQVVPLPPSDAEPGSSERICSFQRTTRMQRIVKCRDGKENIFEHESTRTIVFRRRAVSEAFEFVTPGEPPFNALFHDEGDDAIERMTLMLNENQLMKALGPPEQHSLTMTRNNEESDLLCLLGMILVFFIFFIVHHALQAVGAAPPL